MLVFLLGIHIWKIRVPYSNHIVKKSVRPHFLCAAIARTFCIGSISDKELPIAFGVNMSKFKAMAIFFHFFKDYPYAA